MVANGIARSMPADLAEKYVWAVVLAIRAAVIHDY